MYVTFAPESLSAFRIFFAPRPGSITAASKLASSMRRYALLRSGGTENVETRIWGEETSAVHKPAVVQLAFDRILLPRTPFHSWGSIHVSPNIHGRVFESCKTDSAATLGLPSHDRGGGRPARVRWEIA